MSVLVENDLKDSSISPTAVSEERERERWGRREGGGINPL